MSAAAAGDRLVAVGRRWRVTIERQLETTSSIIAFGHRHTAPVVIKVVKEPGDEWRSGEVLASFGGHGMVRVHDYVDGASLLERLDPGEPLVGLVLAGRDDGATGVLADLIAAMAPGAWPAGCPSLSDWSRGFDRYLASGDGQVPHDLVHRARDAYLDLCGSQRAVRLLHGDLQHYNVLRDDRRGWVAIDPKGVIGELEYELGAALRNPYERPGVFASAAAVDRRLAVFSSRLPIDAGRALAWAFAQSVLSALWGIEDGYPVSPTDPGLQLARVIGPMLG